jgi:hypothetical protein
MNEDKDEAKLKASKKSRGSRPSGTTIYMSIALSDVTELLARPSHTK